jgi:hypothetical protein
MLRKGSSLFRVGSVIIGHPEPYRTKCIILSGGRWPGLGGWPDFAGFGNE